MKEIRIALEDKEYSLLIKAKKGLTWKEWLMRKDVEKKH
jgi:hypothetical protein